MKLNIILSSIISLGINLLTLFINYLYYLANNHLLLAFKHYGGEITIEHGFGLILRHIYAMRSTDRDSIRLLFSPLSFIAHFIVIALIVFIIIIIIKKIKG